MRQIRYRLGRSWPIWIPGALIAIGVGVPIIYLIIRAFQAEPSRVADLVFRRRNLVLLWNTVSLGAGVLAVTTSIAGPLAWLTVKTHMPGGRLLTLLGVLPLSIPGYVMAYVLLSTTGDVGLLSRAFGVSIARPSGYAGALLALSVYTFPYMFMNLRAGLKGIDPALEESARSLGLSRGEVVRSVVLPQLLPAFMAGSLLILLHVLGDFGVVSLMRFETFSYAIFLQYAGAFDRLYAAWLAIMLLGLTGTMLMAESRMLKNTHLAGRGPGAAKLPSRSNLGVWKWPAFLFVAAVVLVTSVLPIGSLLLWTARSGQTMVAELSSALLDSIVAAAPAALLAVIFALPVAYAGVRYPRRSTRILERSAYLGYAIPPLALALAVIFFSLGAVPWLYQTLFLLIITYAVHFLAEAIGPIRTAFYRVNPGVEEAARTLGLSPLRAFAQTVLPVIRPGIVASLAFVFLSVMKELPLTYLLSPIGFETLAVNVWSYTNEAQYAEAAPHALLIVGFSALFVSFLLIREDDARNASGELPVVPAAEPYPSNTIVSAE